MARRLRSLTAGVDDPGRRWRRRGAVAALTLGIVAAHGCVAERLAASMSEVAARDVPARMAASFVREMTLVAPVAVTAPAAAPAPRRTRSSAPRPAAAAASDPEAPPAEVAAEAAPAAGSDPALAEAEPAAAAPAPLAPSSAPADAGPFKWPDSTRMSYRLSGNYRGPVDGAAQVEWIHAGERYQLHLDVHIGPAAAPLMTRRMSSQGRLTAQGLAPERYDEETDRLFGQRRHVGLRFEADAVVLANGERSGGWEEVQDAVSQFVQLTFLMTTQPHLMRPGSRIAMPLALPRRVSPWIYEVLEAEVLATPFGALRSTHLRPRLADRRTGELTAQVWIAPDLQYLPVRIRIEQDAETFIDMMIDRLPLMAAAPAGAASAASTTGNPTE